MQTALWTVYSAYLCPRRTPGIQVYGLLSEIEEALFVPELSHLRMTVERRDRRALQAFRSPLLPWLSAQSAVCYHGGNGCGYESRKATRPLVLCHLALTEQSPPYLL